MPYFKKVLPPLIFGIILVAVFWKAEPPKSLTQTSPFQLTVFFTPLFFFIFLITNLLLKHLLRSALTSIYLLLLIIFQGLGALNWITFIITTTAILLLIKFIKKPEIKRKKTRKLDTPPAPMPSILKPIKELPPAPKLKRLK